MGTKAKVTVFSVMALVLVLGLWRLSGPPSLPSVGTKYISSPLYSKVGRTGGSGVFHQQPDLLKALSVYDLFAGD